MKTENDKPDTPNILGDPEKLEALIDARTERALEVIQICLDSEFSEPEMAQVTSYATLGGVYARVTSLEDLKVELLPESTFFTILKRARFAIHRVLELRKQFSKGPYYFSRHERRKLAKKQGMKWKKGLFQEGAKDEVIQTQGM